MPKQVHPHPPDTMFINSSLSSLRWLKIHRSSQKHRFERIGCSGPKSCESSVAVKITDIGSFLVWATTLDCDRGGKTGSLKERDLMPQRVKLTLQICEDWQNWGVNKQQAHFEAAAWHGAGCHKTDSRDFSRFGMKLKILQNWTCLARFCKLQDDQWPSRRSPLRRSNRTTAESAFKGASASANVSQPKIVQWFNDVHCLSMFNQRKFRGRNFRVTDF